MKRRDFIAGTAGAGAAAFALTRPGFAQQRYEPALSGLREGVDTGTMPGQAVESSPRYPATTLVHALDPRFYKYMVRQYLRAATMDRVDVGRRAGLFRRPEGAGFQRHSQQPAAQV
jgi:hypothetical protein